MKRSSEKRTQFQDSSVATRVGTIIMMILATLYLIESNKTFKEIPFDKVIVDAAFYASSKRPGWHQINLGAFSLEVPQNYFYTKHKGIDSRVGEIACKTDAMFFDYGMYSYDFSEERVDSNYSIKTVNINGKVFKLITTKLDTGTVAAYTNDFQEGYRFSIACFNCSDKNTSVEIIKTIKFKR